MVILLLIESGSIACLGQVAEFTLFKICHPIGNLKGRYQKRYPRLATCNGARSRASVAIDQRHYGLAGDRRTAGRKEMSKLAERVIEKEREGTRPVMHALTGVRIGRTLSVYIRRV